jgi:hypothetical protein
VTDDARLVLVDERAGTFVSLQIRGDMLLEATGTLAELDDARPSTTFAGSPAEAVALRDARVAELVAAGHAPLRPSKAKATRKQSPVATLPDELVASVRRDPDDPLAWDGVADWVLAHAPRRAEVIEREREGEAIDLRRFDASLRKAAFGDARAVILEAISNVTWRAAHITACRLSALVGRRYLPSLSEQDLFDWCGRAPAFALLDRLSVRVVDPTTLRGIDRLAPHLRSLDLELAEAGRRMPIRWLAQCTSLQELTLDIGIGVFEEQESLAHIPRLVLRNGWPDALLSLPLTALVSLEIDLRSPAPVASQLARIEAAAPALTDLHAIVGAGFTETAPPMVLLDALARSPLLSRLRRLRVDTREDPTLVEPAMRATWRGGAFAHLEHFEVPAILARRLLAS